MTRHAKTQRTGSYALETRSPARRSAGTPPGYSRR
jgi:hypothetical protein